LRRAATARNNRNGRVRLSRAKIAAALEVEGTIERFDLDPVVVSIETKLRRSGKGKRLVIENGAEAEVNAGLAAMITEAFAIRNQLLSGSDASIEAMTERLGIAKGRLTSLVRLSYLAPGIVRALLGGRQPIELTPTRLLFRQPGKLKIHSSIREVYGGASS
jgi:site-specific DNA recombinase